MAPHLSLLSSLRKNSFSLNLPKKAFRFSFTLKVSILGGAGQKETPLERRLLLATETGVLDKFTTVQGSYLTGWVWLAMLFLLLILLPRFLRFSGYGWVPVALRRL